MLGMSLVIQLVSAVYRAASACVQVVSRFDLAAGRGDHGVMAQCARIMSHFPRGAETLINVRRPALQCCSIIPTRQSGPSPF